MGEGSRDQGIERSRDRVTFRVAHCALLAALVATVVAEAQTETLKRALEQANKIVGKTGDVNDATELYGRELRLALDVLAVDRTSDGRVVVRGSLRIEKQSPGAYWFPEERETLPRIDDTLQWWVKRVRKQQEQAENSPRVIKQAIDRPYEWAREKRREFNGAVKQRRQWYETVGVEVWLPRQSAASFAKLSRRKKLRGSVKVVAASVFEERTFQPLVLPKKYPPEMRWQQREKQELDLPARIGKVKALMVEGWGAQPASRPASQPAAEGKLSNFDIR